jgi:hypothetical protein
MPFEEGYVPKLGELAKSVQLVFETEVGVSRELWESALGSVAPKPVTGSTGTVHVRAATVRLWPKGRPLLFRPIAKSCLSEVS